MVVDSEEVVRCWSNLFSVENDAEGLCPNRNQAEPARPAHAAIANWPGRVPGDRVLFA